MASLGALVIELAANTARLQGDLGKGVAMLQSFASKAQSVLGVLGFAAGGGILGQLAREAIDFGDNIEKAAKRAGVASGTFSEFAAAAQQADVGIDVLSKGFKSLQVAISNAATKGGEAARPFEDLGIKIKAIRDLTPDQQFLKVADALSKLQDPTDRTRIGTELLSRSYLELAPALTEGAKGLRDMIDEQKRLGNTFSDEQIAKLAATDDAIKKLKASWHGFATTLIAEVAPALTKVFNHFTDDQTLESQITTLNSQLKSAVQGPEHDRILKELRAAQNKKFNRDLENKLPEFSTTAKRLVAPDTKAEDAKRLAEQQALLKAHLAELERIRQAHIDDKITDAGGLISIDPRQLEDTRQEAGDFLSAIEDDADATGKRMSKIFENSFGDLSVFADQAARNMQSAFADFLFDPFQDGMKGMLKSFIDTIRRMLAEAAAAKIFDVLVGAGSKKGSSSGLGGILGSVIGAIFGGGKTGGGGGGGLSGARANGGPVAGGHSYLVGERGPEIFTPGQSGGISTGGGLVVHYSIDARGATTDVIAALPAIMKRNNEALEAKIVSGFNRRKYPLPR